MAAKNTAMDKMMRNLTNPIPFAATAAQYPFVKDRRDITAFRYGVHLEKRCFANALNKATFEAGRALGMNPTEIAHQIGESKASLGCCHLRFCRDASPLC